MHFTASPAYFTLLAWLDYRTFLTRLINAHRDSRLDSLDSPGHTTFCTPLHEVDQPLYLPIRTDLLHRRQPLFSLTFLRVASPLQVTTTETRGPEHTTMSTPDGASRYPKRRRSAVGYQEPQDAMIPDDDANEGDGSDETYSPYGSKVLFPDTT